mmetsp:Transcript_10737/g.27153  ORF Transcript_10737/g.27153 Transcript_10737/m.27153 type:complete len:760 (-) Transcript_10737:178-2457(-)|eukprot:CAMPEP_0177647632 /NCGR_PEP_ID=MMETSP0447-20121125/10402_1 /TAXON_ID=0 /ORGANISM="Stygamoeba regulata, Strain BSH-02190019" /LENGTH=759 /DNA_ID=CAMNT_0019150227 /DNA_START=132 /DNA_END=2411 /DNA_ORIENTATION=+
MAGDSSTSTFHNLTDTQCFSRLTTSTDFALEFLGEKDHEAQIAGEVGEWSLELLRHSYNIQDSWQFRHFYKIHCPHLLNFTNFLRKNLFDTSNVPFLNFGVYAYRVLEQRKEIGKLEAIRHQLEKYALPAEPGTTNGAERMHWPLKQMEKGKKVDMVADSLTLVVLLSTVAVDVTGGLATSLASFITNPALNFIVAVGTQAAARASLTAALNASHRTVAEWFGGGIMPDRMVALLRTLMLPVQPWETELLKQVAAWAKKNNKPPSEYPDVLANVFMKEKSVPMTQKDAKKLDAYLAWMETHPNQPNVVEAFYKKSHCHRDYKIRKKEKKKRNSTASAPGSSDNTSKDVSSGSLSSLGSVGESHDGADPFQSDEEEFMDEFDTESVKSGRTSSQDWSKAPLLGSKGKAAGTDKKHPVKNAIKKFMNKDKPPKPRITASSLLARLVLRHTFGCFSDESNNWDEKGKFCTKENIVRCREFVNHLTHLEKAAKKQEKKHEEEQKKQEKEHKKVGKDSKKFWRDLGGASESCTPSRGRRKHPEGEDSDYCLGTPTKVRKRHSGSVSDGSANPASVPHVPKAEGVAGPSALAPFNGAVPTYLELLAYMYRVYAKMGLPELFKTHGCKTAIKAIIRDKTRSLFPPVYAKEGAKQLPVNAAQLHEFSRNIPLVQVLQTLYADELARLPHMQAALQAMLVRMANVLCLADLLALGKREMTVLGLPIGLKNKVLHLQQMEFLVLHGCKLSHVQAKLFCPPEETAADHVG